MPASMKAINVLGNPTWYGSQRDWDNNSDRLLSTPMALDFDSRNQRLFVGDSGRMYVFDVAPAGMQDFKSATMVWRPPEGPSESGLYSPAEGTGPTLGVETRS
jgi:hypothetical protein